MDFFSQLWNNVYNFMDYAFVQNFVSNLMATVIGVALGIPIALWLNKRVETITRREKKLKILHSLDLEMVSFITFRGPWDKYSDEDLFKLMDWLSDERWRAFSDGGELQWIDDSWLLHHLSDTYAQVKYGRFLLERYFDVVIFRKNSSSRNVILIREQLTQALTELGKKSRETRDYISVEKKYLNEESWLEKLFSPIYYFLLPKIIRIISKFSKIDPKRPRDDF